MSRHVVHLVAALLGAAVGASAQSTFLYAFNQPGMVSANAYPLDSLAHGSSTNDQIWRDLFVQGPDRWLIRGDGRIALNGATLTDLSGADKWTGIVVDDMGSYFALRKGGNVTGPSGLIIDYPEGDFSFSDIETDGQTVYVLKTNGSVYRVPEADEILKFNASGSDGDTFDKVWTRLHIHPVDGTLWALRQDGKLYSAVAPMTPSDPVDGGTEEASLPYDGDADFIGDEYYYDFAFDTLGTWYALRADGHLYSALQQAPPLVNFPGGPSDNSGQTYESIIALGKGTFALRQDGKVYQDVSTDPVFDLPSGSYVKLASGVASPDLTSVKNQPPVGTSSSIVVPLGTDIVLPVLAVDRDLASADLLVEPVTDTLPTGATWDAMTRSINWPDAGPIGKYKIQVTVSDGLAKPVTTKQSISIKALDTNDAKNQRPTLIKISKAVALVALPFDLQIFGYDLDGTTPDLSQDTSGKPLPDGIEFDDVTGILTWDDPLVDNTGTISFKFLAGDGTAVSKRTIKVKVQTSLLGF